MSEIQILNKPFNGEITTIHGQIPIIVENIYPISGEFTLSQQASSVTIQTSKQYSHVIITMHTRSTANVGAVLGQTLFTNQISSEIVNQSGGGTTSGVCSVSYTNNTIVITNTTGNYPANIKYDWWAW